MIYSPLSQHIFIIEDPKGRRTISLEEVKYTIGRHSDNQIVVYSTQASRYHATLVRKTNSQTQDYSYWILDGNLEGCKSQNGIYVNGEKCLVHELKNGDLINFGCDINASYHQFSNFFDSLMNLDGSPDVEITDPDLENYPIVPNQSDRTLDVITYNSYDNNSTEEVTILQNNYLDPVTQLPKLKLFNEHLSLALNNARQSRKILAIFLLEIENLAKIYEKFDQATSKLLLNEFSKKIKHCLRSGDIVGRIQEDKFVILISQINVLEDIQTISQRLLNNLKSSININEQLLFLRSNLGISTYPTDGVTGQKLIEKAENNLEINKQKGYSNPNEPKAKPSQNLQFYQIEKLLHEAIENEEFSLYYQPQVNIKTGEVEALEALLRWEHPKYGLLTPGRFLPVAEKTELIIPITQWVLKTACQQNVDWIKLGLSYLPISVNISPRLFQSPYLTKMLEQILSKTGLDGSLLELEITENSMIDNIRESLQTLQTIQDMNVQIAVDDFGLGYASLSYLSQLPMRKLKIAQTLIHNLKTHPHQTALVSAIIASGHIFGWQVVAEGVETQQQLEILQSLKCEKMQGYRFSQPLMATEVSKFLSLHRTLVNN
ncbi:diguanylate cyclase [Aphanothece hegewaldii CCALA 016]|uniref:Diguanylate cyclase n=1 Tax=Aphanothece hegewaldii CCALA 016 TaxID=2107694 RepID=A0A2T1M105_9CHRO|nr:EAL domain-containing protein [Aphanothece hegewaldii]PSF38361.1 diguanylate cyclase [Aphanothece hegewaldii CCALA 016]